MNPLIPLLLIWLALLGLGHLLDGDFLWTL